VTRAVRSRLVLGAAALVLGLGGVSLAAEAPRKAVTHTVTIDATAYSPKTVTVAVGDEVVWVNKDVLVHTVTARDGGYDSRDIPPGGSWSFTPKGAGLFPYHCSYHVPMKGTLRVR
jgi:plastocyanin